MERERKTDFPCLICGKVLYREFDDEGQPRDGVVCHTHGNYGSRVFDDLHGEYLSFNICDDCLRQEHPRIFICQGSIPVWAESGSGFGVCGAYPVDRPYVPWRPDMEPSDERFTVDVDEIIKQTYPKSIRWNDGGKGDWPDMLAAASMAERGDAEEMKQVLPEYAARIDAMMAAYEERMKQIQAGHN